jgi:hypothetical protein
MDKMEVEGGRMGTFVVLGCVVSIAAMFRLPLTFYKVLRFYLCGISAMAAYFEWKRQGKVNVIAVMMGAVAVLYNPIRPFFFYRSTWRSLNIVTALIYLLYLVLDIRRKKAGSGDEAEKIVVTEEQATAEVGQVGKEAAGAVPELVAGPATAQYPELMERFRRQIRRIQGKQLILTTKFLNQIFERCQDEEILEAFFAKIDEVTSKIRSYKYLDVVLSQTIEEIMDKRERDRAIREEEIVQCPRRDREAEMNEAQERARRYQEKFEKLPESAREAYIAKAKEEIGYEFLVKKNRDFAEKSLTGKIYELMEKDEIIV